MKLKYIYKLIFPIAITALSVGMHSCIGDLDANPIDPNVTMEFDKNQVFTKIYATLGLTGQEGPAGKGDLADIDEGTSGFFRVIWYANELITDECIVNSWNDPGLPSLADCSWGASNELVTGLYYRLTFDITLCNFFLEQTEGLGDEETIRQRAEVGFIRALNYYYLIDLYGNVPLMEKVSIENPVQINRADMFTRLEETLLNEIIPNLADPGTSTYGRVDRAAGWLLLARLYLNAQVYTGTPRWNDAATYAKKVIDESGYTLSPSYEHLFMADNDGSTVNKASQEVLLPIICMGETTKNYGNSLFLIAGTRDSDMPDWGLTGGWAGPHCRESMVQKFFNNTASAPINADKDAMIAAARDDRALMYSIDRTLSTGDNLSFKEGFSCVKFTNRRADGASSSNAEWPDTDIPFLRLAEAHLTLAEASIRANGGSSTAEAKAAIDELRNRANAPVRSSYSLDDVLDEWAREFWFEGRRRMDLIRFNRFGGNTDYNWDWKGGVKNGTIIQAYRNLYPIPTRDLNANSNLKQNPGY